MSKLGPARRVRLHRQIGEWKEAKYGDRAAGVVGELVVHFSEGKDYRRAVHYHCQVGEVAFHRSAYREAIDHCKEGLALLARLPDSLERQQQELALRMLLSGALTATQGFGTEELGENLLRARALSQALNDKATLVSVLVALGRFYDTQADQGAVEKLMGEERRLLEQVRDEPPLAIQLHTRLGSGSILRAGRKRDR